MLRTDALARFLDSERYEEQPGTVDHQPATQSD